MSQEIIEGSEFCAKHYNEHIYRETFCSYLVMYNQYWQDNFGAGSQWIGLCQECLNFVLTHGYIDESIEID